MKTFRCKQCGRVAAAKEAGDLLPHEAPDGTLCDHNRFQDVTGVAPDETPDPHDPKVVPRGGWF